MVGGGAEGKRKEEESANVGGAVRVEEEGVKEQEEEREQGEEGRGVRVEEQEGGM